MDDSHDVRVRLTSTKFSCDELQIGVLHGEESLGKLFAFNLDVVVTGAAGLEVDQVIGADATLVFEDAEGHELRVIHGIVAFVKDYLRNDDRYFEYRLRLVPRAYRMAMNETQEVFLGLTVPEIITQRFARAGLEVGKKDLLHRLTQTYPSRDLVVQYRESDLAFVSRLAEHLGIAFRIEHDEERDRVVFSDGNDAFPALGDGTHVPFDAPGGTSSGYVVSISTSRALVPLKYAVVDYHDQRPKLDLTAGYAVPPAATSGEWVEYGSFHIAPDEGKALAKIRAEERATENNFYEGRSTVCTMEPGRTFAIEGHARMEGTSLLLAEVTHDLTQTVMTAGGEAMAREPVKYTNQFRAAPAAATYRPLRRTKKPRISGLLHAITEGSKTAPTKRIAHLDDQGRYIVQFYFDMADDTGRPAASAPVRMLQPHAGQNYGMHFPLKPGVEVLIGFVDGDPDRPLIVGAVPNPLTPSPVAQKNAQANKILTESGLFLVMKDY